MIQPLRQYHRWAFEGLGILLPVIFLAGLAARPSATKATAPGPPPAGQKVYENSNAWKAHAMNTVVYSDGSEATVVLSPAWPLQYPDLLLFWSPMATASGNAISADAKLLGSFESERPYALPANWKSGSLLLYSLAHRQVVDHASLDRP